MTNLLAQIDFDRVKVPASGGLLGSANAGNLTVGEIIGEIFTTYVFYAAGVALLFYLIIGGFQFMFSRGDPKAAQAAQSKITNAAIGFVIVFLAYIIVQLIAQLFGLKGTIFGQIFS